KAVRTPGAKFNDAPPARRSNYPRGLRRDHRLEIDGRKQERLDDLRFNQRCCDPHKWLACKGNSSFRHRPHFTTEPKIGEIIEKLTGDLREYWQTAQVFDFLRIEPQSAQVIECLFQPCNQQI